MSVETVENGKYKVKKVRTGILSKIRLANLGILPNSIIEVRNVGKHYPCIIYVKGSELEIGRILADRIKVEKI